MSAPRRLSPLLVVIAASACEQIDLTIGVEASGAQDSGGASAAGPTSIAAVVPRMAPDSWFEIPGSRMDAVCPEGASAHDCAAVMEAWSGGALDDANDRLIVFGGGASDSPINSVFTFDLGTLRWTRWTDPPAPLGASPIPASFLDRRVESCGLYPSVEALQIPDAWLNKDGFVQPSRCEDPVLTSQLDPQQPRSAHSLGNVAFSAVTGTFYLLGTLAHFPSGLTNSTRVWGFSFATRSWSPYPPNFELGAGTSATDDRGHIWYVGREPQDEGDPRGYLAELDPASGAWERHSTRARDVFHSSGAIDPVRRRLVTTPDAEHLAVYDLASPTPEPAMPHGPATGERLAPGFVYLPGLDRFLAWTGGRSLRWLDPGSWAWTERVATGADPGAQAFHGTFGRMRHSARWGVVVVVSGVDRNVFLYRPPAPP